MKLKKLSKDIPREVIERNDAYWKQFYREFDQPPKSADSEKLNSLLKKWLELTEIFDKVSKDLKETKKEIVKILNEKKFWDS
ncbi:MAG: hypothetical protein QXO24_01685, partial [Candidatus Micrarchaeaceae archaeon]